MENKYQLLEDIEALQNEIWEAVKAFNNKHKDFSATVELHATGAQIRSGYAVGYDAPEIGLIDNQTFKTLSAKQIIEYIKNRSNETLRTSRQTNI